MNIQTPVILAGFCHAVSETRLSCAAQSNRVNRMALDFVKQEAAWNSTLATRASQTQLSNDRQKQKNHDTTD